MISLNHLPALLNPHPQPFNSSIGEFVKMAFDSKKLRSRNIRTHTTIDSEQQNTCKTKEKSISPNLKSNNLFKKEPPVMLGDLITENSCNAVDCEELLKGDTIASTSCIATSVDKKASPKEDCLNFNGKIEPIINENKILAHDTSIHMYTNEKSPDLFEDDDDEDNVELEVNDNGFKKTTIGNNECEIEETDKENVINEMKYVKTEEILLKRLQMSLTGVVPPPHITISQLNLPKMIELYRKNDETKTSEKFELPSTNVCKDEYNISLLTPTFSILETSALEWPDAKTVIGHGIYYNRSKYTEKFEALNLKYVERYIGAETSSSFTINQSPTSAKKRTMRLK